MSLSSWRRAHPPHPWLRVTLQVEASPRSPRGQCTLPVADRCRLRESSGGESLCLSLRQDGCFGNARERDLTNVPDLKSIIHSDPEIHSGDPVFVGTRVPVRTLLDYIEGGDSIDVFLDNFPSVTREQAIAFLEEAARTALAQIA